MWFGRSQAGEFKKNLEQLLAGRKGMSVREFCILDVGITIDAAGPVYSPDINTQFLGLEWWNPASASVCESVELLILCHWFHRQ